MNIQHYNQWTFSIRINEHSAFESMNIQHYNRGFLFTLCDWQLTGNVTSQHHDYIIVKCVTPFSGVWRHINHRCVAPHHSSVCGATPFVGVWRHVIQRCVAPHLSSVCGATPFSGVWRHIILRCVAPHHSEVCGATIWLFLQSAALQPVSSSVAVCVLVWLSGRRTSS